MSLCSIKAGRKEYGHLFELNATNSDDQFFDVHEKENSGDATTSGKIKDEDIFG